MKRIIASAIIAFALCGCDRDADRIENGSIQITHHEYNGHQYLRFKDSGHGSTYLHDPDCAKCKGKKGGEG